MFFKKIFTTPNLPKLASGKKIVVASVVSALCVGGAFVPAYSASAATVDPAKLPQITSVTTNGFQHPGIVNSVSSLETARNGIIAEDSVSIASLNRIKSSRFGKLTWTPHPVEYVRCGSYSKIDLGCTDETNDAQAAYTHALLWYFTGNKANAAKSIEIMNAWSATIKDHPFDTQVYKNGLLQSAWAGETFTKAAELIRYSSAGWSETDIKRFENMLNTAYLPRVRDGWKGGGANWQLSMAEATMNIGVFTNNREVFNDGLGDWRNQLKAHIFLASDGLKQPAPPINTVYKQAAMPKYWNYPNKYVDGLESETCRDASHMAMGFAAAFNAAETAGIQGIDLYKEEQKRLVTGMEFNTRFINNPNASGWVCPKPLAMGGEGYKYTWAIGYQHYTKMGVKLPETKKLLQNIKTPQSGLHMNWEILTHGAAK